MENNIQILNVMGNDLMVVNSARVSFNKESNELTNGDIKLIHFLSKNGHNSPFFHPQIQLRIKMPLFIAREWFRHTVGFSRNEVSRRYVDYEPNVWCPEIIRERDVKLKQGSKDTEVENNQEMRELMTKVIDLSIKTYNELIQNNVAPEVARIILPQSTYTEFIETGSLYAYARLCKLRLDKTAQLEIRQYAQYISDELSKLFPHSWNALLN